MTAADQTPATDSERDERAIALCSADDTREHHDQTDAHPCTRCQQTADNERLEKTLRVHSYRIVRESHGITLFGCWGCDWQGDSSSIATHQADMLAVAVVNPLLALLAERAATIERVTVIVDALGDTDADDVDPTALYESLAAALGSQRTEGQG